jgi:hypothetical protein
MNEDLKIEKFQEEVFPQELLEVAKRRANRAENQIADSLKNTFTTDNDHFVWA